MLPGTGSAMPEPAVPGIIIIIMTRRQLRSVATGAQTGRPNITETIIKRRHMLFGHVARLDATTPAHQILKQVIAVKSGYQPDAVWRRALLDVLITLGSCRLAMDHH